MPSRIRKDARSRNIVLKAYQDIASKKGGSTSVENRLKAADRLAVILGMFPSHMNVDFIKDPDPSQITFAVPEEEIKDTVSKMLEKLEEKNADTVHSEERGGSVRQDLQS